MKLSRIWLTATISGPSARPQLLAGDSLAFELDPERLEPHVLQALDQGLPVCCMVALDPSGETLLEVNHVFIARKPP